MKQIEKAVSGKEPRFVLRALRALPSTSRRLNTNVVNKTICGFFTNNNTTRDFLLSFLEEVRLQPDPEPMTWSGSQAQVSRVFLWGPRLTGAALRTCSNRLPSRQSPDC